MANDFVQTMIDARVDARSLSDFMFYPASEMITRRLAPSIHTLNYYLDYFNGLESLYSQESGTVTVNGVEIKTVRQAMIDAIDDVLLGEYQDGMRADLNAQKLDTGITTTAKFGGVERELSDKLTDIVTINDFGIVGDGVTDELAKLNAISLVTDTVDLLGKTVFSSSLPSGTFVNGVIKTPTATYNYGLISTTKSGYRIGSWNIWGHGSSNTYFSGDVFSPKRMSELKTRLLQFGFDAVGMQESLYNPATYPYSQYIVKPFIDAMFAPAMTYVDGNRYGNTTLTNSTMTTKTAVVYASAPSTSDKEYRSYCKTVHKVNGKNVAIYNTHLSLDATRRASMIAELCNAVLADTSNTVFVLGDFNTDDWSLFSPITNAGFKQVNNNTIDTNPSGSAWYIDEIFYKGATKIGNAGVFSDQRLGDHSALYADFNI